MHLFWRTSAKWRQDSMPELPDDLSEQRTLDKGRLRKNRSKANPPFAKKINGKQMMPKEACGFSPSFLPISYFLFTISFFKFDPEFCNCYNCQGVEKI